MFAQRVCSMLGGAFFVGAFVLTLVAIPSGASAFTFTTIDPPGATQTVAAATNARGQIVGFYIVCQLHSCYELAHESATAVVLLASVPTPTTAITEESF